MGLIPFGMNGIIGAFRVLLRLEDDSGYWQFEDGSDILYA